MEKVVHFEIPADDLDRAQKFYGNVFGWNINKFPGMDYYFIMTVETDEKTMKPKEPGAINGGMMKRTSPGESPVIVIDVQSLDDYIKKVEGAGGKIVLPKMQISDLGLYARVADTEGNVIGLFQSLRK